MKHEIKQIKHTFTPEELNGLHNDFHRAVKDVHVVNGEFDGVKADYKARVAEVEARADRLSATIDAGFEFRDTKCVVVFRPKQRQKDFYHESFAEQLEKLDGKTPKDFDPLLTEEMTDDDLQRELIEAESIYDLQETIVLCPPPSPEEYTHLLVGEYKGKWFSALRIKLKKHQLQERLDGEQPSFGKRFAAVQRGAKRFCEWLEERLGKEVAAIVMPEIDKVLDLHRHREE